MGPFFYLSHLQSHLKSFHNKSKSEVLANTDQLAWPGFKYFFFVNRSDYPDTFKNVDHRQDPAPLGPCKAKVHYQRQSINPWGFKRLPKTIAKEIVQLQVSSTMFFS